MLKGIFIFLLKVQILLYVLASCIQKTTSFDLEFKVCFNFLHFGMAPSYLELETEKYVLCFYKVYNYF